MIIGHRQIRNIASFPVIPKTKLKISLKKSSGKTLFCILLQLAFILENHLFYYTLKDLIQNWNLAHGPVIVQYYICFSSFIWKYTNDNFIENHNCLLLIVLRWKLSSSMGGVTRRAVLLHSSSVLPPPHVPMRFMVMSHLHLTVVEVRKAFGLKCVDCSAHLILTECWTYAFSHHLSFCARGWGFSPSCWLFVVALSAVGLTVLFRPPLHSVSSFCWMWELAQTVLPLPQSLLCSE